MSSPAMVPTTQSSAISSRAAQAASAIPERHFTTTILAAQSTERTASVTISGRERRLTSSCPGQAVPSFSRFVLLLYNAQLPNVPAKGGLGGRNGFSCKASISSCWVDTLRVDKISRMALCRFSFISKNTVLLFSQILERLTSFWFSTS